MEPDLATVVGEDGVPEIRGRLEDTEGVAGILVDGRLVSVDDEGWFQFRREANGESQQATDSASEMATTINEEINITVLYADGRQAGRKVAIDAAPVLAEADTVVAADGSFRLDAKLEELGDVASVLINGEVVEVDDAGNFELILNRNEININRFVSITIVLEDGTRRSQRVAVASETVIERMQTTRRADGRPVVAGVLEDGENIAELRIDGRSVSVDEAGRFEVALARAETTINQSVNITVLYKNGSRADRRIALKKTPPVAGTDLVNAPDGTPLARWAIRDAESVAEIRVDGRPVPMAADGSVALRLSKTQLNVTDNVSLTIIYKDGTRVEQRTQLRQRRAARELATLATTGQGAVIEGRIDDVGTVSQVLVDGAPLAVGEDGSFRIDMAERNVNVRRSFSMTIVYADGTRKVERLGVTPSNMFTTFEAALGTAGQTLALGRVAEPDQVGRVLVDGRAVEFADDGSFSLEVAASRINIDRQVNVTIVYRDGARVSRQVALRADSIIRNLDMIVGAGGNRVVSGRLAGAERIASMSFAEQPVPVAADGTFRLEASETAVAASQLQIIYTDGTRQAQTIRLQSRAPIVGLDTYAASDGAGVVEGRLANVANVAALFIDGGRVAMSANGGFSYRHESVNVTSTSRISIRVVYKNGAVSGRRINMNVNNNRAVMLVKNVSRTADGFSVTEAILGNGTGIAGIEIAGRSHSVGAGGRITFTLPNNAGAASGRVPVRVLYANGLDAETWLAPAQVAGGLIPLPRMPRKVALMIGNSRYGGGIGSLATATADAGFISNVMQTRFGFESRVLSNASQAKFLASVRRLGRELSRNDQLVVHYSGRSFTDRRTGRGYWLPSDARTNSATNWVSTDAVYRMLQDMGLRGAMILSDGSFRVSRSSRTLRVGKTQTRLVRRARTPVSVIASGFGRPARAVPGDAHSAFTWRLASTLSGIGSETRATDLFRVIRERLTARRPAPGQAAALIPSVQVQ